MPAEGAGMRWFGWIRINRDVLAPDNGQGDGSKKRAFGQREKIGFRQPAGGRPSTHCMIAAGVIYQDIPSNFRSIARLPMTLSDQQHDHSLMDLQRFQILINAISDYAIYVLDPDGRVVSWNSGAQRFKGYKPEEIIGHHFSCFFTPEDQAAGLPTRALTVAAKEGRFESEGWRLRNDGTRFWANAVIDAIRTEDGRLLGFAKITRDISEKRAAEEALRRTEQALQQAQKMESIGKLTGGVAHDFNNLLQIISGNLQLLAVELTGNEAAQARITAALAGVNRGARLASYLLAFGRRQALDPKVVNIGRFVIAMEDMLRRTLGEAIEVETIISGGLWNTLIDVAQVENALLNLALNARDAMADSGKLTIEIGNAYLDDSYARGHADLTAGQYVMIAVTDTGTGMSRETLAQAFEPFFSTKPEGKGSGLGLSMVYGFVKQSGGHVQIYSELGQGTTVKLYLPRVLQAEDAPSPAVNLVVMGGSEVILVAEDDAQLCDTVVDMLRDLGYQVLKANDALGALAILESGMRIDLLFTDVVMPGPLRSTELARKAKAIAPDLAVLFTSGYTQNAIVHGGRLDPGVELLSKPYTREALARKVRHVLANQKHVKQLRAELAKHAAPPVQSPVKAPQRRILLVEDEPIVRATSKQLLQQLGHTVLAAADAESAFVVLAAEPFDVLITDVELPGISGTVLAQRALQQHPELHIIYASGHDRTVDMEGGVLLKKPYDIHSLQATLDALKPRRR
jgi:PAS domain S-box-containing protein